MLKNALILVLLALVIWLSVVVIRLENFRYASALGFCSSCPDVEAVRLPERYECLRNQETRTSAMWHLFYALTQGV